jgi:hypothetical protein
MAMGIPQNVREVLQVMGRFGGPTRAQKYSKEQLAAWGRLGGRPRGPHNQGEPTNRLVSRDNNPGTAVLLLDNS